MNMEKAIEIVKAMVAEIYKDLDGVQSSYGKTRPDSIYDVEYRRLLEQMHDRLITKSVALNDVLRELNKAKEASEGIVDKGV